MIRLVAWVALGLAAAGCARIEPPSGGPEDRTPPALVAVRPDTLATVAGFQGDVLFVFDERISEQGVEEAVSVSPRTSPVAVDHSGRQIRVSLRRGWEPNRIYQVRVDQGIRDLFGNALPGSLELIFSTGPTIPETRVAGSVTDRITGSPAPGARVEAIRTPDSLVYATRTDSAGGFVLRRVPEGSYQLRAFVDANRNRELDPFEARDAQQVQISVAVAAPVLLRLLLPDTTPPALASARPTESGIEVRLDDYLDPAQPLASEQVRVTAPEGRYLPVSAVRVGSSPGGGGAPADTAAPPSAALPSQLLWVTLAEPLAPNTSYRIRVSGVRNLHGLVGGGELELRTPAAAPPAPAAVPRP